MRKVLAILAAALLLFTGAAAEAPDPTPAPDWPEGWIRYDQPAGWLETEPFMWYWVYTPENLQPGAPLVIYLHSSLGMNRKALTEPLPRRIIDGEITDVQAVVLVPQLPGDTDKDWLSALDQVNNIIVKVMEEYQIDPERVSGRHRGVRFCGIGARPLSAGAERQRQGALRPCTGGFLPEYGAESFHWYP